MRHFHNLPFQHNKCCLRNYRSAFSWTGRICSNWCVCGDFSYAESGTRVADLDLDARKSYGPETTTLYNPVTGDYKFYVHNYSGSPDIKSSGATVKVFTGNNNEPAYTFSVPLTGNGQYWNVFTYNSKTRRITPVNTVSSSPV